MYLGIQILCDNTTAVHTLNKMGMSHSASCNNIIRNIWSFASDKNIWLSASHISYKLAMLLCLLTGQRNQSIAALDIDHMSLIVNKCTFFIPNILPVKLIQPYLARTSKIRKNHKTLILSFNSPHKPVTSSTLAWWCKEVLDAAGINSAVFKAHSTRGSSTSLAYLKGLNLNYLRKAAGWTNDSTFAKFYKKPIVKSFSEAILS